jgi:hypothetical protein
VLKAIVFVCADDAREWTGFENRDGTEFLTKEIKVSAGWRPAIAEARDLPVKLSGAEVKLRKQVIQPRYLGLDHFLFGTAEIQRRQEMQRTLEGSSGVATIPFFLSWVIRGQCYVAERGAQVQFPQDKVTNHGIEYCCRVGVSRHRWPSIPSPTLGA